MSIIQIQHLYKTFGTGESAVHALEDINLDIQEGEIFGIIGLSGAGKSTLVRCMNLLERPTSGSVMVDGLGVGDVGNVVLRDRKHLSQDGLIIVVVGVNRETGLVTSGPELISRGFVYVRENEELISGARNVAMNVLQRYDRIEQSDWTSVKNGIKDEVHNYLFDLIKRNPMILPIIMET